MHSGDYGQLWLNVKTTDVRWIAGDADDEEAGCSSAKEIRHALKIPGVRRVDVLVEYGVPESASWVYLAHAAKTLARPSYPA